jgi:hypothetical protein
MSKSILRTSFPITRYLMENPEIIPEFRPQPAPDKHSDNVRIEPKATPQVVAAAVILLVLGIGVGVRLGRPPVVVSTPAPVMSVPLPLPPTPPIVPLPTAEHNLPLAPAELGKTEDTPVPAGPQAQHPASAIAAAEDDAQCPVDTEWRRKVASERAACMGLPWQILTQERSSNGSYLYREVAACPAHQTPMRGTDMLPTPHPSAVCECRPNTCQPPHRAGWLGQ